MGAAGVQRRGGRGAHHGSCFEGVDELSPMPDAIPSRELVHGMRCSCARELGGAEDQLMRQWSPTARARTRVCLSSRA